MKTVPLTQDHINNGVARDAYSCPIACALKEAGYQDPSVDYDKAFLNTEERMLSPAVRNFIEEYDSGEGGNPATLCINKEWVYFSSEDPENLYDDGYTY